MKLDNRPKKLLVKGVEGDEGFDALKTWYEAGGQVESIEKMEDGAVLVSFKSRAAAEQVCRTGDLVLLVYVDQLKLGPCEGYDIANGWQAHRYMVYLQACRCHHDQLVFYINGIARAKGWRQYRVSGIDRASSSGRRRNRRKWMGR